MNYIKNEELLLKDPLSSVVVVVVVVVVNTVNEIFH